MKFNERAFNILSLAGVFAMLVIVIADYFVPKPHVTMDRHAQEVSLHGLRNTAAVYDAQLKTSQTAIGKFVWTKSQDEISSQSLKNVTAIAAKHKVQLLGFRPQKPTDDGGFTHLPYLVLLSGKFPNVASTLEEIEAPVNRLAVSLVQFASSDANSDGVNATIGVIAYSLPKEALHATTAAAK
jgi:hypothetical protein